MPTIVPLLALTVFSSNRNTLDNSIPLRPTLYHASETRGDDSGFEKFRLLPKAGVLVRLVTDQSSFRSCELAMVSAQRFVLVASQTRTKKQQLRSILEVTEARKL